MKNLNLLLAGVFFCVAAVWTGLLVTAQVQLGSLGRAPAEEGGPLFPAREPGLAIQGFTAPLSLSQFKLIAFDMDSTLISIECVDEIADAVGRKAEVAAITEAAMRGEITDFKDSLRRRLALLKGVTLADMERVYTERLKINPGAADLIAACQKAGMKVLLVSGGFTFFGDRVKERLNIDFTDKAKTIGECETCGEATSKFRNCANLGCRDLVLLCDACAAKPENLDCQPTHTRGRKREAVG